MNATFPIKKVRTEPGRLQLGELDRLG
jgi:hypothetical protein